MYFFVLIRIRKFIGSSWLWAICPPPTYLMLFTYDFSNPNCKEWWVKRERPAKEAQNTQDWKITPLFITCFICHVSTPRKSAQTFLTSIWFCTLRGISVNKDLGAHALQKRAHPSSVRKSMSKTTTKFAQSLMSKVPANLFERGWFQWQTLHHEDPLQSWSPFKTAWCEPPTPKIATL